MQQENCLLSIQEVTEFHLYKDKNLEGICVLGKSDLAELPLKMADTVFVH